RDTTRQATTTRQGIVTLRRVLRKFVRLGLVLNVLLLGGRIIGTTGEHPFFVKGQGWTLVCQLEIGDVLVGHDNQTVVVAGVRDTETYGVVYNLRVAEYHTYFVGRDD
ncbi:MAG: HINT domain-containing protein, partial [Gemmata sp.]|nr:HINT domain-containing protein [Gemmata sp.]